MKTKNLIIIFSLFLFIALAGGLAVFLAKEKNQPVVNEQPSLVEAPAKPAEATATAPEKIEEIKKTEAPRTVEAPAEEKISAVMMISGLKYEAAVKSGSSAYDLMNLLRNENKIDFSGKDYAGLGFFVEAINGVKNNPAGENWIYYVNGQPGQVGISNYLIKSNDIIEWKYEKKSF